MHVDIVITGVNTQVTERVKGYLQAEFQVSDLGHLKYSFGMEIARSKKDIYISQM